MKMFTNCINESIQERANQTCSETFEPNYNVFRFSSNLKIKFVFNSFINRIELEPNFSRTEYRIIRERIDSFTFLSVDAHI